jgi:hypothetical protein
VVARAQWDVHPLGARWRCALLPLQPSLLSSFSATHFTSPVAFTTLHLRCKLPIKACTLLQPTSTQYKTACQLSLTSC